MAMGMQIKKLLPIVITSLLVVGSLIGVIAAFNTPETREKTETRLSYDIKGSFDHQAYGRPKGIDELPSSKLFPKITESLTAAYSYKFLPQEPVSRVTETVEITALLGSPGCGRRRLAWYPGRSSRETSPLASSWIAIT